MRATVLAAALLLAGACRGDDDAAIDASPIDAPPIDALPIDARLEPGAHTLAGVVRYEDRPQRPDGRLGAVRTLPARGIQVSLVADGGQVLGSGVTGDDGSYSFAYARIVPAAPAHLLAATISTSPERPIAVRNRAGQVHGVGGPSLGKEKFREDLLVTEASGEAEAFNVFDQLVVNADAIRLDLGLAPAPLTAVWERGNPDGTYYGDAERTVFVGGTAGDDDGYDDTVILHECGHFVESTLGRSDTTFGQHGPFPVDPNLAWSEGFATYWAMAARSAPFYGDSNAGGGWAYDAESSITPAMPAGGLSQLVVENMITEILWDLGDGADDDPLAGDHTAVRQVQPRYLRSATLRAVGDAGVDLVDFLDGWFLADGLARCAEVRAIVTTARGFPYDYAGPAGLCP